MIYRATILALFITSAVFAAPPIHDNPATAPQGAGPRDRAASDDVLRFTPATDPTGIDLACRKHKIALATLRTVNLVKAAKEKLAAFGNDDIDKIRDACLDAVVAADLAEHTMGNMAENKQDDARDVKRASPLYDAAMNLNGGPVKQACRHLINQRALAPIEIAKEREALVKELDALEKRARDTFKLANGENSHRAR